MIVEDSHEYLDVFQKGNWLALLVDSSLLIIIGQGRSAAREVEGVSLGEQN